MDRNSTGLPPEVSKYFEMADHLREQGIKALENHIRSEYAEEQARINRESKENASLVKSWIW